MTAILDIPLSQVRPQRLQPREYFAPAALRELADSLAAIGQVVPVQVVRLPAGNAYELIDGERRLRAAKLAGLATLRAEVIPTGADTEALFLKSVVANISREPNHHMEIAHALGRLHKTMTHEAIAQALGKSESYVRMHLKLLDLHPDLEELLHPLTPRGHRLPITAAVKLAGLARGDQIAAYGKVKANGLPVGPAIEAVIDAYPTTHGCKQGPRTRPADVRRTLLESVRWFSARLLTHDAEFDAVLARADAVTRARLVLDLERLIAQASRLLDRVAPPVTA